MDTNDNQSKKAPCAFCNGFYGPTTTGPVCSICHMFIFEYNTISIKEFIKDKDASDDSGNEDPEDKNIQTFHDSSSSVVDSSITGNYISDMSLPNTHCSSRYRQNSNNNYSQISSTNSGSYNFDRLPTEILLKIFQQLDDISLWSVRFLSKRLKAIIDLNVPDDKWRQFVEYRWPLFECRMAAQPRYRDVYSNLMKSVTCRLCWERMREVDLFVSDERWLSRRLKMESDILVKEHPYGISARCLDPLTLSCWVAAIAGPSGSEYEGGLFYVLIKVPSSYPMRPPAVQFLTRIFHPNISKHGEIGIDLLSSNWSLALTISKLLISIQSLLTDPNGRICMEPEIGDMFNRHPAQFKRTSRLWTWKYAMHDYLPPGVVERIQL